MLESSAGTDRGGLDISVGRAVARLGRHVEIALGAVELTTAQYRALVQLSEGAEASSSLAAKLAVSRPSATMVVDGLVQRGLVDREHSAADRRRVSVTLTEAGWQVLARADSAVRARLDAILAELTDDEVATAISGLEQWRSAMIAYHVRRHADQAMPQAERRAAARDPEAAGDGTEAALPATMA